MPLALCLLGSVLQAQANAHGGLQKRHCPAKNPTTTSEAQLPTQPEVRAVDPPTTSAQVLPTSEPIPQPSKETQAASDSSSSGQPGT